MPMPKAKKPPKNVSRDHMKYAVLWFEQGCKSMMRAGASYDFTCTSDRDCKELSKLMTDEFYTIWDAYIAAQSASAESKN